MTHRVYIRRDAPYRWRAWCRCGWSNTRPRWSELMAWSEHHVRTVPEPRRVVRQLRTISKRWAW